MPGLQNHSTLDRLKPETLDPFASRPLKSLPSSGPQDPQREGPIPLRLYLGAWPPCQCEGPHPNAIQAEDSAHDKTNLLWIAAYKGVHGYINSLGK